MRASRRTSGFSLVELLVVIALVAVMAGALAPLTVRQMTSVRRERALDQMRQIVRGLAGDTASGQFGYVGDMGALPASLADLNSGAGKPAYGIVASDGVGYGWGGPYAPGVLAFTDPWSTPYSYSSAQAQVTSAGPDRTLGSADDLVHPPAPLATTGSLSVSVIGIPSGGGPPQTLNAARAEVWVASSVAGSRSEVRLSGSGPFTGSNLHLGHHAVRVVGRASYNGAVAYDVATIHRGTTVLRLSLEQP
jgi:general secretion pathway protein G